MKFNNLVTINESHTTIQGREFAIENKETGEIFISNKKYVDKLFSEMGYKSLGVIKILEDYAGKFISDVGNLISSEIFVDRSTGSFIVTNPDSVIKLNNFFSEMNKSGYEIVSYDKYDDFYYWDQLVVKSTTGTYFALYINLCEEAVHVLSLKWDGKSNLEGIIDEGKYNLKDDDFMSSIMTLMDNPIDASVGIDRNVEMSYNEVIDLFKSLGLVKLKRKKAYLTDEGEVHNFIIGRPIDFICDDYNTKSWIQRSAHSSKIKFDTAYNLIGQFIGSLKFWDIMRFYIINAKETSDMFMVNF